MNEPREDKELEQYLAGNSDESRRYVELGDDLPPVEVDARILAEAERAVKVTPLESRRAPPFKAFAWAAIVVLSFSLVLNIVFEQSVQDPVAELESMAGRYDEPIIRQELKGADDVAAKRERVESRAPMAESVQPYGVAAGKPSRPMESPEIQEEILLGSSERAVGDALESDEGRLLSQMAATEAAPAALALYEPSVAADGDSKQDRDEAMQVIADYLAEIASASAVRSNAVTNVARDSDQVDAELRRILDLYADGAEDDALTALAEFRDLHPDHPVSQTLTERESR